MSRLSRAPAGRCSFPVPCPPPALARPSGRRPDDGHRPLALIERDLVDEALPDRKRLHSRALDRRNMDEDRRTAVFGLDEAKALPGIERRHGADHAGAQRKTPATTTAATTVHTNIVTITPIATAWNRSDFMTRPGPVDSPTPAPPCDAGAPSRVPGVAPPGFASSSTARTRCHSRSARAGGGRRRGHASPR